MLALILHCILLEKRCHRKQRIKLLAKNVDLQTTNAWILRWARSRTGCGR